MESKGSGHKALGLRLPDGLHAQFALVAQLDELSLGDALRKAVEEYVQNKQSEPDFAARAQSVLEAIEQEAAARRAAIQGLFGASGSQTENKAASKRRGGDGS